MPEKPQSQSLAVLIDADNTSARHAHAIFEEIVKLGEANVRRKVQRSVATLHHCSHRQPGVLAALAAPGRFSKWNGSPAVPQCGQAKPSPQRAFSR